MDYVLQVRGCDKSGLDLFRNNGYSAKYAYSLMAVKFFQWMKVKSSKSYFEEEKW
ncbi:MAG: hypothetical protein ACOCWM_03420 [Cyclobacteriaceae bacterium]